tara:strand:+ start:257 stop:475 length:219 start_codon:yes stop_codon:yes gene_type:complete
VADIRGRGKTGNYGITYSSGVGSVGVARRSGRTTTTVIKPMGRGVSASASGGKNQPTTFGASRTQNNTTWGV